jgi:hypothetical protein
MFEPHAIALVLEKFLGASAIHDDPISAQGVASGINSGTRPKELA